MTALMLACDQGNTATAELLIVKGADLEAKHVVHIARRIIFMSTHSLAQDGWTPLMWACFGGHTDTAELLIDKGANMEATNKA
jgi:ankyrin repeat protein